MEIILKFYSYEIDSLKKTEAVNKPKTKYFIFRKAIEQLQFLLKFICQQKIIS